MQLTCPTTLGHENWLNARDMPWEKLIDGRTSNTFQISEGLPRVGLAYTEAKFGNQKNNNRVQGSPSGESTRFPPMWPGIHSQSSAIRGLSLLLVLFSAPSGFSLGTPGFTSPQNPAFPNSNSTCIQRTKEKSKYCFCHLLEIIEGC